MKRFRSPLSTLARLRLRQQRERELALAQRRQELAAGQRTAESLRNRCDADLAAAMSALRDGMTAPQLLALHAHLDHQRQAIAAQHATVAEQAQQVQAAIEHLRTAVAEAAVVDRLLTERNRRHRRDVMKHEQLILDEHSTRRLLAMRAEAGAEH